MNKDFHYYGTYCAAIIAGFDPNEAKKIAFYAQFVDESTKTNTAKLVAQAKKGKNPTTLNPVYTIQSTDGLLKKYGLNPAKFTTEELAEIEPIWCSFHFLPGGTNSHPSPKNALICQPNSTAVFNMVEQLINHSISAPYPYAHIGMVMHILADTWSHRGFAGIPSKTLNEIPSDVLDQYEHKFSYHYIGKTNLERHSVQCTPLLPRDNSISYLGHGRIGALPDSGYLTYHYTDSANTKITKNNPHDFEMAFKQMVYVMECIKNSDGAFNPERFRNAQCQANDQHQSNDNPHVLTVRNVIRVLTETRGNEDSVCQKMEEFISTSGIENLPEYSHLSFFGNGTEWESLLSFFSAAANHRQMVCTMYPDITGSNNYSSQQS